MINPDYWKKLKDGLDCLIEEHRLEGKQIYVLPADEYAVEVVEYLKSHNLEVDTILDNRSELVGERLCGIRIQDIQDVLYPFHSDKQVVLATSYWNMPMIQKLDFIECWHNVSRFLLCEDIYRREPEKAPSHFDRLVDRIKGYGPVNVLRRYRLHRRAQNKIDEISRNSCGKLYLFPHPSIGDIFILGTYLSQNNEKFKDPFTLVVVGNACKKIAIQSGFKNVEVVDHNTMNILLFYKMFMGEDLETVEILHYDFLGRCICNPIFDQKKFTFYDCYKCMVFGDDTKFVNSNMEERKKDVSEYCKKQGIVKGKTVILAPYNKSLPDVSPVLWESLTAALRKQGYTVVTNSANAAERPVHGTLALGIPLETINEVVEYAGVFIGMRSGLCDVVSGCNARKIVISPNLKGVESTIEEFYGFGSLELQYPMDEVECDRIPDVKDAIQEIMEIIMGAKSKGQKEK